MKTTTIQESILDMMGTQQTNVSTTTMVVAYETKDVSPEGVMHVTTKYESVRVEQVVDDRASMYDSTDPTTSSSPAAASYKSLLTTPLEIYYLPDGSVQKIEGLDKLVDDLLASLPNQGSDPTMKETMRDAITKMYEDMFTNNATTPYKDEPVSVGDSWEKSMSMDMMQMMTLDITSTYTLKSQENGRSTLDATGKGTTSASQNPLFTQAGLSFIPDMILDQKGTIVIDDATGLTASSEINQVMDGKLTMEVGTEKIEVPLKGTTKITMELIK